MCQFVAHLFWCKCCPNEKTHAAWAQLWLAWAKLRKIVALVRNVHSYFKHFSVITSMLPISNCLFSCISYKFCEIHKFNLFAEKWNSDLKQFGSLFKNHIFNGVPDEIAEIPTNFLVLLVHWGTTNSISIRLLCNVCTKHLAQFRDSTLFSFKHSLASHTHTHKHIDCYCCKQLNNSFSILQFCVHSLFWVTSNSER